jgi:hypothetical protein
MKQQSIIYLSLIVTAAVLSFLVNAFVNRMAKGTNNDGNESPFLIFKAALFFVTGYILSGLIVPLITLLRVVSESEQGIYWESLSQYYVAFLATALTAIALVYALSFLLFSVFCKKTKLSFTLANNETSSIIFFVGLLLLFAFISKEFLPHIVDTFIPYPQIPIYR